jgi:hypothetical protein
MAQTTRLFRHVHEVPERPLSVHASACLHDMATALARTGPVFCNTFYGGPPRNAYDPILTVVIDRDGYRFTTDAAGDGETVPAVHGHSAHNTLDRAMALEPLNGPAGVLQRAVMAFPVLRGQHGTLREPVTLLRLSFHLDVEERPFFHLQLAGASYPANLHSRTPEELVQVESWRFHVLAHAPAWDVDAQVRFWAFGEEKGVVVAPDSAQARILFAARCASRTRATETLFSPRQVPLWTCDDGVESERLVRNLFAPTTP